MKYYIILALFGQIQLVVGPVPYDHEACIERAAQKSYEAHLYRGDFAEAYGRPVGDADVSVVCVPATVRPLVGGALTSIR